MKDIKQRTYTEVTAPLVHSSPVQGTGLDESPQGLVLEVPVGTPEGVVLVPGGLPVTGGVPGVPVVGVLGAAVTVHAASPSTSVPFRLISKQHSGYPATLGNHVLQSIKEELLESHGPLLQPMHMSRRIASTLPSKSGCTGESRCTILSFALVRRKGYESLRIAEEIAAAAAQFAAVCCNFLPAVDSPRPQPLT